MNDLTWLLLYVVACEAIVNLWFHAGPLAKIREITVRSTPSLTIEDYGNLFECPFCISVWVAIVLSVLYTSVPESKYFILVLVIHRLSNHFHLIFSYLRDKQLDLRVNRNRKGD